MLEKKQASRYLRQIIIPEVGNSGQEKLLDTFISVWGENVKSTSLALYYIAASGCNICCQLDDCSGFDGLSYSIHDLNDDVSIEQSDGTIAGLRIIIGDPEFILKKQHAALLYFIPTMILLYNGWKGGIQLFESTDSLKSFFSKLSSITFEHSKFKSQTGILSYCFGGALSAVEALKHSLDIGMVENFLYFDLLSMKFSKCSISGLEHMLKEICLPDRQCQSNINLKSVRVLIVGAGGLGSPAAYTLALSGIGTLGLVDYDCVDISNLNRQILHSTSRIGMPKVESSEIFLKGIDPSICLKKYNTALSVNNVFGIIHEYDAVICAVDNFAARFLLNDACFFARKPMIDAGVLRFDGNCMTIIPKAGPCYRCLLPDMPTFENAPCSKFGVLGPVPGVMGVIEAAEAIKLVSNIGAPLLGRTILYEGLSSNFEIINIKRNSNCKLCGDSPIIKKLHNYSS